MGFDPMIFHKLLNSIEYIIEVGGMSRDVFNAQHAVHAVHGSQPASASATSATTSRESFKTNIASKSKPL